MKRTDITGQKAAELDPKDIGRRIKQWRIAQGHREQAPFAELIGLHLSALKKYESGVNIPGGATLATFAEKGLNLNWLLTGEGEMTSQVQIQAGVITDKARLLAAIAAVEEGLSAVNRTLRPDKKAELVLAAYELMAESESDSARERIVKFIRAVA